MYTPPSSSMQNQESSIYSHTHEYQFIKKATNYHHNQPVGKVTQQIKNKGLFGAIGGIIQLWFYLFCVRIFKLHDTYFFDINSIESIFYPGHLW